MIPQPRDYQPVVVDVGDLDAFNVDELAKRIADEQKKTVGATYAYCSVCGLPVHRDTARACAKKQCAPHCKRCLPRKRSTDPTIYLCAVCRVPLTGVRCRRAREAAREGAQRGKLTSCGREECLLALRRKVPILPCVICREPSDPTSSRNSWRLGTASHCKKHLGRKRKQERLPCTICGSPSTIGSDANARRRGNKPYCEKHPRGRK